MQITGSQKILAIINMLVPKTPTDIQIFNGVV